MKPTYQELEKKIETLTKTNRIIERSPVVLFRWHNKDGWPIEFASKNADKIFGYTAEEFLSNKISYSKIIHPNDLQKVNEEVSINSNYNSKSFSHEPYRITSKSGKIKWVKDDTYIIRDETGKITHFEGIIIDITRQIEAEEQLIKAKKRAEESEDKYHFIMENASDVIWILNIKLGKFTYISPSVYNLRGYTVEEAIQQDISQSLTPESAKNVMHSISQALEKFIANPEKPVSYTHELRQPCKSGNIIWIETSTRFQYNSNGEIEVVGISRNIEDRKKAEQELIKAKKRAEESEKKYKLLATNTLDTIWTTDIEFNLTYVNNAVYDFLGYKPEEFLGLHASTFTTTEGMNIIKDSAEQLIAKYKEGKIIQHKFELQQIKKDGSVIEVEIRANLLLNKIGEITGFHGRSIDITERKQTEQALKESEARFRDLFMYSPVAYQSLDETGKFVFVNPALTKLLEYDEKELIGTKFGSSWDKNYQHLFSEKFKTFCETGDISSELQLFTKTGKSITVQMEGSVQYDEKRDFVSTHCMLSNITERKEQEQKIKLSEAKLKKSKKKLQEYKKRIAQTLKGTDSGTFIYDIPNEVIILDKIGQNLLGLNKSKLLIDEWEAIVHAGDKNKINAQFSEGFKNQEKTINITYRIKTPDQTIGHIQVNSIVKYFKTKPFKVYGIILNITQQKKIEEELVIAKQKLNEELAWSKRDLVSTAIELSTISEVIINSLKTINKLLEKHTAKKICEDLLNVKKELEYQLKKQDIWELFKMRFRQVHPKFFIKLGTKYPSLSKSELLFCAYLRVHLSSDQIAAALNISKEGIRKARYRIRKKIGLDPKKSLEQYISKF